MLLDMLHAIVQNVAVSICLVLALSALLCVDWQLHHIRAEMKRKAEQVRIDKDRWLDTCRKKIDSDSTSIAHAIDQAFEDPQVGPERKGGV